MKGPAVNVAKPWYREPWPWLLMAGPAIVIVAGIATTVLAVTSFDGLVADDYYKQGLSINRVLARDEGAKALGITALVQFDEARSRVRVMLAERTGPATLRLALSHPTLAGEDQEVSLRPTAPGVYEGAISTPRPGRFRLKLEDGEGRWRLAGEWVTTQPGLRLAPR
jgi:hypothetical protein